MDQAAFLSMRATGLGQLMQVVWIYEHPVDMDGLKRFHGNFGYGLFGRRIQRSALPVGSHRWVAWLGPPSDIDIAEHARPRAELSDWVDERAELPVDPEGQMGWHLGVLPLTDGSTAVSLVMSHCLADGIGATLAIIDAVKGNTRDLGYPSERSGSRLRSMILDAIQIVQSTPEMLRTLSTVARVAIRRRHDIGRAGAMHNDGKSEADGEHQVRVPAVTAFIDVDEWDARAEDLGGTSYSLFAGLAAKLAEGTGRVRAEDGAVSLIIPISDRTKHDTRANAMPFATVDLDPRQVTNDLSAARVAIRRAVKIVREEPDETSQILPLIQLVPGRLVNRLADVYLGTADLPVSCSNLGELDSAFGRPDGTDAEYVILRGLNQSVARETLERTGGQLSVVSGRIGGSISISVVAYRSGGDDNSKPHLRELVSHTLAEFGLTDVVMLG
jgi:hypothetical protein